MDDEGQEKEEVRCDFHLEEQRHPTAQLPEKPQPEST